MEQAPQGNIERQDRQPNPLTLIQFASVVERLKKKKPQEVREQGDPSRMKEGGDASFVIFDKDRIKVLTVIYNEIGPINPVAAPADNLPYFQATATIVDRALDSKEVKKRLLALSKGFIFERNEYTNPNGEASRDSKSSDISDEDLENFIEKDLMPFLKK